MDPNLPVLPPPTTPPRRPPKCSNQLVGQHFESPKRRRRLRHDSEPVVRPGLALEARNLIAQMNEIRKRHGQVDSKDNSLTHLDNPWEAPIEDELVTQPSGDHSHGDMSAEGVAQHPEADSCSRRLVPDDATNRLYRNWFLLIPTLVHDYLAYMRRCHGRLGRPLGVERQMCQTGICESKLCDIQCLHFDRMSRRVSVQALTHLF